MTKKNLTLFGFASDEGITRNNGRPGAAEGPLAILQALSQFDSFKKMKLLPDILVHNHDLESAQQQLAAQIQNLFKKKITPVVMGGGHEMAYGHGLGVYKSFPEKKIGIVNFDAHFDLRPLKEGKGTSGTPFLQLADFCQNQHREFSYMVLGIQKDWNMPLLFETAERLNVTTILREEMEFSLLESVCGKLSAFLKKLDGVYLTVCLDVFHKDIAPGVSARAINGISWEVFATLFRQVIESQKVLSLDVAEMSPPYDIDSKTAKLAATIINEFVEFT